MLGHVITLDECVAVQASIGVTETLAIWPR